MIAKRIDRKPGNDNYRALALYVADAKSKSQPEEKSLISWQAGCLADNYHIGIIEVEATQSLNTRTKKEKTYHLMVSFRPEDEVKLTPKVFMDIEENFADALGFSEHQRHCGVHKNTSNIHMHIAYNMINPKTFNRTAPYYDFQKLSQVCRKIEAKYGLETDQGIDESKDKSDITTNAKAQTIEAHTGQQSLFSYALKQKAKILEAVATATTWEDFHTVTLKLGLEIKRSGNGLAFQDRFGKHRAKASDIDRGLSKANLEKSFGLFCPPSQELLLTVKTEKSYTAVPLHLGYERDNLYEQYKAELAQRKTDLESVKATEREAFQVIKTKWADKRKIINSYAMLPVHKMKLLHDIKIGEQVELEQSRKIYRDKQKEIREVRAYSSWAKFLQHQAGQGNEVALAILRSKKVKVEPEKTREAEEQFYQVYENNRQMAVTIKQHSHQKQKEILDTKGIAYSHKKALLSISKMNELMEQEALSLQTQAQQAKSPSTPQPNIPPIQTKIDAKGTVIFTLPSGGTIRDTGAEIHFSPHDPVAHELAQKFAAAKWGTKIEVFKNSLKFKVKAVLLKTLKPKWSLER